VCDQTCIRFEPNHELLVQYLAEVIATDPAKVEEWLAADPVKWAEESFDVVEHDAYHFLLEPHGTIHPAELAFSLSHARTHAPRNTGQDKRVTVEITKEYYAHSMSITLERLAAAGVRLAHLLNQALA
jgi:hypothetical protein